MPETHPYPGIWAALAERLAADPLPAGEWKLLGAIQHAQAEQDHVLEAHRDGRDCDQKICGTCGRPA